eukprot:c20396_g1_i1.p1 GENE.c20396_g1_i1~~c20396_g1_i1.p1  ORF type:complete len:541 (-),score=195.18 c20396_g1_i1:122-1744(-)
MSENKWNATVQVYQNTEICRQLHGLERRDRSGNSVTNKFSPTDAQYLEGVAMMSVLAFALALLTVLFFGCRCLCRTCKWLCVKCATCKAAEIFAKTKPHRTVWVFRFCGIFIIGGVIYGFIANGWISDGVNLIKSAVVDMDDMRVSNVNSALSIATNLEVISVESSKFQKNFDIAYEATTQGYSTDVDVTEPVTDIIKVMNDTAKTIREGANTFNSVSGFKDTINDNMSKYDQMRYNIQLGILAFLCLPFVIVAVSMLFRLKCLLWNITWISVLCAFVGWLLTGVETSFSVLLADVCYDPNGFAIEQSKSQENIAGFVRYYVLCDNSTSNPLQPQLDDATEAILEVQSPIALLRNATETLASYNASTSLIAPLNDSLAIITSEATKITDKVLFLIENDFKCNRIHNNLVTTLNGLCGGTLSGFAALVLVQGAMAFLTWVAIYCGIVMYRYFKSMNAQNADNPQLQQDPVMGLLTAKKSSFYSKGDNNNNSNSNNNGGGDAFEMSSKKKAPVVDPGVITVGDPVEKKKEVSGVDDIEQPMK